MWHTLWTVDVLALGGDLVMLTLCFMLRVRSNRWEGRKVRNGSVFQRQKV
jgi:hypothetical protein